MKKFNLKEKFLKITLAAVTTGLLFGALFTAPLNTDAATAPTGAVATPQGKILLSDQLFSADGINDPVEVRVSGKGTYQAPSDYIYYGNDRLGNPLLWRVLDSDADNAGERGAMFLFSEQIIEENELFGYLTSDQMQYHYYELCKDDKLAFYGAGDFEYTYHGSYMEEKEFALRRFVPNNYYYFDILHESEFRKTADLDVYELSAIRPITKTDTLSDRNHFGLDEPENGMNWTVNTVYDPADYILYSGKILVDDYIFPLSIDELEKYVADYSGAPGMAATVSATGLSGGWWLRTAYDSDSLVDIIGDDYSTYKRMKYAVGYVDGNGSVGIMDSDYKYGGGRYGINLETDRITYGEMVEENVWRLAILESFYKNNPDKPFNAWIKDVRMVTEEVGKGEGADKNALPKKYLEYTVSYENAIGTHQPNYWDEDGHQEFISIMILDKDGNSKYYGTMDEVARVSEYGKLTSGEAVFRLPDNIDFDERQGDRMMVFWERRNDDGRKTSFTSNMVEIECAHSDFEIHNCIENALCNICGARFGEIDPNNHLHIEEFAGTPENPQHGYKCMTEGCPLARQVAYIVDCTVVSDCLEIQQYCSCGNGYLDEHDHVFEKPDDPDFVVTGFCEFSNKHYQPAKQNKNGEYVIENVGNFLWFAEQINKGKYFEGETVIITAEELDFEGIEYFDVGSAFSKSFSGTLDGNNVIIKNLRIQSSGFSGLFSYTYKATIKNIRFESVNIIGGYDGGIVVSQAGDTLLQNIVMIGDGIAVDTADGMNGALIGDAKGNTVIENCFVYGPVSGGGYDPDREGEPLPFFANGEATVINSYCLAYEENEYGGRTAEQMASGEIAYLLGWGQKLGRDDHPSPENVWIVYLVPDCGNIGKAYSNSIDGREAHTITVFVEEDGYRWDGMYCDITLACEKCGHKVEERLTPENGGIEIEDMGGGASYTFTAIIDASNGYFTDDNFVIAKRIEDVTAVERIVKDFDGEYVTASDLLNNTKMNFTGFDTGSDAFAYFVDSATGKYLGTSVAAAGVYDLVVDGRLGYETQKYIYKEIVVINKITLTLDVSVDPKYYDGKTDITYSYGFLEDTDISLDWLEVVLGEPSDAEIGEYTVPLTLKYYRGTEYYPENPDYLDNPYSNEYYDYNTKFYYYDDYKNSIDLVYDKSVTVFISPVRQVELSANGLWKDNLIEADPEDEYSNDYYLFEYGEKINAPTSADFSFCKGSKLSFRWYKKQHAYTWDESLIALDSQPTDAGEYILRVTASATENLIGRTLDIEVEIAPKTLTVEFIVPDDAEYFDYYGEKYYIFEYGQYPELTIGIPGGEWAELGITFDGWNRTDIEDAYRYYSGYPTEPGLYWVNADINIATGFNRAENYQIEDNTTLYIMLVAPKEAVPVDADHTYDGSAKDIEVILPEGWTDADYSVEITNMLGETVTEIREAGIYTVTVTDRNGAVNSATVRVRRELRIYFKETSIELTSDGNIDFDLTDFYFTPGYTLAIGHTLVDVDYKIHISYGEIVITNVTVMAGDEDVSYLYYVEDGKYFGHGDGNYKTVHIFDSPCDSDCNASGCEFTRTVAGHHGGVATCVSAAICEVCGAEYGEYDHARHASDNQIYVQNATDLMMHDLVYACCGEVISTELHHVDVAATCTDRAVCKACTESGVSFGELDPHNHSSEELRYELNAEDADWHDAYHTCCDTLFETVKHSGGVADCVSAAVCEVCGNSYGELDPENHTDVENHTKATCKTLAKCSACEAEYGSLDPENHESDGFAIIPSLTDGSVHEKYHSCCDKLAETEEHSGGKATCNSLAVCEICGGEYGDLDPDAHVSEELVYTKNDRGDGTHDVSRSCCGAEPETEAHSGGKATCHSHAVCDKCGEAYGELAEHSYDNACDTVCNDCNEPTRGMTFHVDADGDLTCDECGADVEKSEVGAVEGTDSIEGGDKGDDGEESGLSGREISAIAVGSTAVAGAGGFSLFWFVIQKKSWAELLGLLIG